MTQEIRDAVTFIETHYTSPIKASDAAAITGYSYHHFMRKFRAETGRTFFDVISELRVKFACQLLQESSLDMQDVSRLSGFNSLVQFHRVFKALTGMTPMRYRVEYYS